MPNQSRLQPTQGDSGEGQAVAEATRTLASLNEQADALRLELAQLRQRLEDVRREFTADQASQLREANAELVLAALHAESIAESAVSGLSELARTTQRDALTDTPNRALMFDRIAAAIAMAQRHQTRLAVLFLDIDDFKQINDTWGHATGDAVLQLAARQLEFAVRHADTVSRYGGDEFLVLATDVSQPGDVAPIAEKILSALAMPSRVGEHVINLSASIGIAVYPEDGEDAPTLIARADAAMYQAKRNSGRKFHFYGASLPGANGAELAPSPTSDPGRGSAPADHGSRIVSLREANERLILAAMAAQEHEDHEQDRHRRQVKFMGMVAHELRNPLSPIRMAAELLKRASANETLLAHLQRMIEEQVACMTRLIDDLLDLARGSTGKFRLERRKVDMNAVLRLAIERTASAVETRRQHLNIELPLAPPYTDGDPVRLAQIFGNLLDNASKYTPEGGEISLRMATEGETIVVTVSDNGIGITAEALPHIFELFVQDERNPAAHSTGLGIGLAVVHDLVEAHGGTVVAKRAGADLGSEFVVRLPLLRSDH